MSEVLFAESAYNRIEADATLPAKFKRLLGKLDLAKAVKGKKVCVKMHLGGNLGYTTIHPFFVRLLVEHLKALKPNKVFVCDGNAEKSDWRGYTEETLGCPIVGLFRKGHPKLEKIPIGFRHLDEALVSSEVLDADLLLVLSHVKGHGACGFGGACKNIAMGMVPGQTRSKIHSLEGGIDWDKKKCVHCGRCVKECPNKANKFTKDGTYEIFYHNCTYCQHCILACPVDALRLTGQTFQDFQHGLALVTKGVIDRIGLANMLYVSVLMNITIYCDCWGLSTPSLVPDIGILASRDIVAIERASLDLVKTEDLLESGLPKGRALGKGKHLFEKIHGKDPYLITKLLKKLELGSRKYTLEKVK